jgi:hypothetical protein
MIRVGIRGGLSFRSDVKVRAMVKARDNARVRIVFRLRLWS